MPVNWSNFISGCECNVTTLPSKSSTTCDCTTWSGRLNDLYFIECDQVPSESNYLDTAYWQGLVDNDKIFNLGVGIGSYGQKNITTFDKGGCGSASVEQIEWQLTYQVYCIDKSTQFWNHEFADTIVKGAMKHYNLVARYCDGDNMILPIGKVNLSSFDSALPASTEEFMSFTYEFSWKGLYVPAPLDVPGLSSVLPKASA
jgi:hypothetical protein